MLTTINIQAMYLLCFIGCKCTDFQGNIKRQRKQNVIQRNVVTKNLEYIHINVSEILRFALNDNQ